MDKTSDAFDGYAVTIFLDEDGDYLAHLTELPNVSAFGATHGEALDELKTAWEFMQECYQRDGIPVPKAPPDKHSASCPKSAQSRLASLARLLFSDNQTPFLRPERQLSKNIAASVLPLPTPVESPKKNPRR